MLTQLIRILRERIWRWDMINQMMVELDSDEFDPDVSPGNIYYRKITNNGGSSCADQFPWLEKLKNYGLL